MHTENLANWTHDHYFHARDNHAEKSTRIVVLITGIMMVTEITAGWIFNSMALFADGWHMSSHALAIGLSAWAYSVARKHSNDQRYAFGTWKIEVLAGYTSAILLLVIAAYMVLGSVENLRVPKTIRFSEAIPIAVLGLIVNIVCALILGKAHHHGHGHSHGRGQSHDPDHGHGHPSHAGHHDLNLKSAYIHVAVDAATSVFAILALTGGLFLGWVWLDPIMGIVGAVVVTLWAWSLIKETGNILLDREMDRPIVAEIKEAIDGHPTGSFRTRISDLHVWRVGKDKYSCALSLVTDDKNLAPQDVKNLLRQHEEIAHLTIEINQCPH